MLLEHIGTRKSGFVFQTSCGTPFYVTHVLTRGLHPVLAELGEAKTGFHAFRRFRVTHLRKQVIPEDLLRFWIGHGDKTVTDGYSKLKYDLEFRRDVANTIPLGFELPAGKPALSAAFVPNVPGQKFCRRQ